MRDGSQIVCTNGSIWKIKGHMINIDCERIDGEFHPMHDNPDFSHIKFGEQMTLDNILEVCWK
jgi:hypothetical protein